MGGVNLELWRRSYRLKSKGEALATSPEPTGPPAEERASCPDPASR